MSCVFCCVQELTQTGTECGPDSIEHGMEQGQEGRGVKRGQEGRGVEHGQERGVSEEVVADISMSDPPDQPAFGVDFERHLSVVSGREGGRGGGGGEEEGEGREGGGEREGRKKERGGRGEQE